MQKSQSLISRFMGCSSTQEAIDITENCSNASAFVALVDDNGTFFKISKTAESIIGCNEQKLVVQGESIFSMAPGYEKSELFKACSSALIEGSVYRIRQHIKCADAEAKPVVTHLKKVQNDGDEPMLLCLNVVA